MAAKEQLEKREDRDHDHDHDHDHGKDRDKCRYHSHHIHELEKTVKKMADRLDDLGRGAHLHELQRIIDCKGWVSPAELVFVNKILDHIFGEICTIERLQVDLAKACRKVDKDRH
jgi:hypothetical protein